jgi:hypothetical protein
VLFKWLPPAFAVYYWRRFFASEMADYIFGRHARAASREMRELANDCRTLLGKIGVEALALRQLYSAIDAYVPQRLSSRFKLAQLFRPAEMLRDRARILARSDQADTMLE